MKKIKRYLIYLRLWFIKRMGYKLPSLREASFVVPGQLYDHFAYIVRAVPRKEKEKELLQCYHCDFHRREYLATSVTRWQTEATSAKSMCSRLSARIPTIYNNV